MLSRVTVEGNGAGLAKLRLSCVDIRDAENRSIPADLINGAKIAVSKDLDGDGMIGAAGDQGAGVVRLSAAVS